MLLPAVRLATLHQPSSGSEATCEPEHTARCGRKRRAQAHTHRRHAQIQKGSHQAAQSAAVAFARPGSCAPTTLPSAPLPRPARHKSRPGPIPPILYLLLAPSPPRLPSLRLLPSRGFQVSWCLAACRLPAPPLLVATSASLFHPDRWSPSKIASLAPGIR
jgi:hypothetical protein